MTTEIHPSPSSPRRAARSNWLFVPPPLLFVVAFVLGLQLHRLVPEDVLPATFNASAQIVGVTAIVFSALLIIMAPGLFLIDRTTIIPHEPSRVLVTRGPFRLTRNPMYLALATGYVGIALVLHVFLPLLLLPLPLWIMNAKVIPCEERALDEVFGDEYRRYQQRVRRWI